MAQTPDAAGGNKFSEEHLKLMVAIGHQAALAVEDTQYYRAMVQAERLAAVGQTVATLSHHVKNVLQGIRAGSYLIELGLNQHKDQVESAEPDLKKIAAAAAMIQKGWGVVDKNQEKISTLVLDMLTFSKERDPEPAPSDINQIVGDIIELMQQRAKDLDVEVIWKPQKDIPILMFDPDGLHRAVLNIVTNAIDACDQSEAAKVEVTTEYNSEQRLLRVVVVDNGSGIEPDDLENIFSLFVSKKGGRGTGLGLSVSQKILKEHGGRIVVDSQVGRGSRFALELPALQQHESQPDDSSAHRPTISLDGSDLTQS
jgi:signal transduction histidine kinase